MEGRVQKFTGKWHKYLATFDWDKASESAMDELETNVLLDALGVLDSSGNTRLMAQQLLENSAKDVDLQPVMDDIDMIVAQDKMFDPLNHIAIPDPSVLDNAILEHVWTLLHRDKANIIEMTTDEYAAMIWEQLLRGDSWRPQAPQSTQTSQMSQTQTSKSQELRALRGHLMTRASTSGLMEVLIGLIGLGGAPAIAALFMAVWWLLGGYRLVQETRIHAQPIPGRYGYGEPAMTPEEAKTVIEKTAEPLHLRTLELGPDDQILQFSAGFGTRCVMFPMYKTAKTPICTHRVRTIDALEHILQTCYLIKATIHVGDVIHYILRRRETNMYKTKKGAKLTLTKAAMSLLHIGVRAGVSIAISGLIGGRAIWDMLALASDFVGILWEFPSLPLASFINAVIWWHLWRQWAESPIMNYVLSKAFPTIFGTDTVEDRRVRVSMAVLLAWIPYLSGNMMRALAGTTTASGKAGLGVWYVHPQSYVMQSLLGIMETVRMKPYSMEYGKLNIKTSMHGRQNISLQYAGALTDTFADMTVALVSLATSNVMGDLTTYFESKIKGNKFSEMKVHEQDLKDALAALEDESALRQQREQDPYSNPSSTERKRLGAAASAVSQSAAYQRSVARLRGSQPQEPLEQGSDVSSFEYRADLNLRTGHIDGMGQLRGSESRGRLQALVLDLNYPSLLPQGSTPLQVLPASTSASLSESSVRSTGDASSAPLSRQVRRQIQPTEYKEPEFKGPPVSQPRGDVKRSTRVEEKIPPLEPDPRQGVQNLALEQYRQLSAQTHRTSSLTNPRQTTTSSLSRRPGSRLHAENYARIVKREN